MEDSFISQISEIPQLDVDKIMSIYAIRDCLFSQNEIYLEETRKYLKNKILSDRKIVNNHWADGSDFRNTGKITKRQIELGYIKNRYSLSHELNELSKNKFNKAVPEDVKELCRYLYDDSRSGSRSSSIGSWFEKKLGFIETKASSFKSVLQRYDEFDSELIDDSIEAIVYSIDKFNRYVDAVYDCFDKIDVHPELGSVSFVEDLDSSQKKLKMCIEGANEQLQSIQENKDSEDLIGYVEALDKCLLSATKMVGGLYGTVTKDSMGSKQLKAIIMSLTSFSFESSEIKEILEEILPEYDIV